MSHHGTDKAGSVVSPSCSLLAVSPSRARRQRTTPPLGARLGHRDGPALSVINLRRRCPEAIACVQDPYGFGQQAIFDRYFLSRTSNAPRLKPRRRAASA